MTEMRFKKGDRVNFRGGDRLIEGVVKEDRGPIGRGGRRLYGVEFWRLHVDEPSYIELPAIDLQLVPETVSTK